MKHNIEQIKATYANLQQRLGDQPLSLALGDYVIYEGERINALPYSWKMAELKDKEVIITAISADASRYCIEGWNVFVDRASLRFVREGDIESLTRIVQMLDGASEHDRAQENEFRNKA